MATSCGFESHRPHQLVGESGSGKSVTSWPVMGLLQMGSLVPSGGSVRLVGEELLAASDRRLRQLRATAMAMIFQEPMTALNPVVPVGRQIDEMLRVHTDLDARARRRRILSMMEQVRRRAGGGRNGLGAGCLRAGTGCSNCSTAACGLSLILSSGDFAASRRMSSTGPHGSRRRKSASSP
jgi:hypothetical protein